MENADFATSCGSWNAIEGGAAPSLFQADDFNDPLLSSAAIQPVAPVRNRLPPGNAGNDDLESHLFQKFDAMVI